MKVRCSRACTSKGIRYPRSPCSHRLPCGMRMDNTKDKDKDKLALARQKRHILRLEAPVRQALHQPGPENLLAAQHTLASASSLSLLACSAISGPHGRLPPHSRGSPALAAGRGAKEADCAARACRCCSLRAAPRSELGAGVFPKQWLRRLAGSSPSMTCRVWDDVSADGAAASLSLHDSA